MRQRLERVHPEVVRLDHRTPSQAARAYPTPNHRVTPSPRHAVTSPPRRSPPLLTSTITPPLTILHAHARFVAIEKPSGLLSVPGKAPEHHDSVLTRARAQFPYAAGSIIVHRLDWETSGVMLLALDADAHARLGRQFEKRAVGKTYIAVLAGAPREAEGEIRLPLKPDWARRPHQVVDHERGREAITRYRVLRVDAGRARVEFTPLTGRTHQIRVHAAIGLGLPILGDGLYGDRASAPRLMLHAAAIEFFEPVRASRTRLRVESPTPF